MEALVISVVAFVVGGLLGLATTGFFLPYAFVALAAVWGVVVVGCCCDGETDW